jgi:hypothetical protein
MLVGPSCTIPKGTLAPTKTCPCPPVPMLVSTKLMYDSCLAQLRARMNEKAMNMDFFIAGVYLVELFTNIS